MDSIGQSSGAVKNRLLQKDSEKQPEDLQANQTAARKGGEVRFSRKQVQNLTENDVRRLLEDSLNGAYASGSYIPLRRNTPAILIEQVTEHSGGKVTVENLPVVMQVGKAQQAMGEDTGSGKNRGHDLTVDNMVEIIKGMDDPVYIVLQNNGRYAEVTRWYEGKRHSAWVVLDFGDFHHEPFMNGYEGGSFNVLVTTFSPDNLRNYMENTVQEIVYDKAKDAPGSGSGRKWPSHSTDTPFAADSVP